jgi:hypothetical protein
MAQKDSITRRSDVRLSYILNDNATLFSFNGIALKTGDQVTFRDRFGKDRTGRVVFSFPTHVTLNMGGRYGTPAIADMSNIVKVKVS